MKIKLIFILFIFFYNKNIFANEYIEMKIDNSVIKAISYEVNSKIYDIEIVKDYNPKKMHDFLKENSGITGINGVFFCPKDYKECDGRTFTGNERYIRGEKFGMWDDTGDRVVFGWDEEENVFLFQTNKINKDKESKIYYGLGNYPLLLRDGKTTTFDYWELGLIANNMKIRGTRNFICNNKDNSNIFFGTVSNANIDELTIVLLKFGCYNALNLDAGHSLGFIYNSRYLAGPGRDILDGIIIKRRGININQLEKYAEIISIELLKKLNGLSINQQLRLLDGYIDTIFRLRTSIYSKYSTDITDIIDGKKVKLGYRIKMDDLNSLKQVNIVNKVSNNLIEIKGILTRINNVNTKNNLNIDFKINF